MAGTLTSTPKTRSPSSTSTSLMGKPGPQPRSITLLATGSVFAQGIESGNDLIYGAAHFFVNYHQQYGKKFKVVGVTHQNRDPNRQRALRPFSTISSQD